MKCQLNKRKTVKSHYLEFFYCCQVISWWTDNLFIFQFWCVFQYLSIGSNTIDRYCAGSRTWHWKHDYQTTWERQKGSVCCRCFFGSENL